MSNQCNVFLLFIRTKSVGLRNGNYLFSYCEVTLLFPNTEKDPVATTICRKVWRPQKVEAWQKSKPTERTREIDSDVFISYIAFFGQSIFGTRICGVGCEMTPLDREIQTMLIGDKNLGERSESSLLLWATCSPPSPTSDCSTNASGSSSPHPAPARLVLNNDLPATHGAISRKNNHNSSKQDPIPLKHDAIPRKHDQRKPDSKLSLRLNESSLLKLDPSSVKLETKCRTPSSGSSSKDSAHTNEDIDPFTSSDSDASTSSPMLSKPKASARKRVKREDETKPKLGRRVHGLRCDKCESDATPQWRYVHVWRLCNACYMRVKRWMTLNTDWSKLPPRTRKEDAEANPEFNRKMNFMIEEAFKK